MEWNYDPSQYAERTFEPIPIGDHRVKIIDVVEKTFKSGNGGYEITLEVSGYSRKLWFYLVLDPSNKAQTNQRLGEFFESFDIKDYSMGTGKQWIGRIGGVRVKHELYNGTNTDKVHYLLTQEKQLDLPAWQSLDSNTPSQAYQDVALPDQLPF